MTADTTSYTSRLFKTTISAYHGWGFDGTMWDDWKSELSTGWQMEVFDRGYFQAPHLISTKSSTEISKESTHFQIIVSHSLGLHFLSKEVLQQADLLVIISGFEEFHKHSFSTSKRAVSRMVRHLAQDHLKVLTDFHIACFGNFHSHWSPPESMCDLELLTGDLQQLDSGSVNLSNLREAKSILILHGAEDHIVPVSLAVNLHSKLDASKLVIHEKAGHALPMTHARWCLFQIIGSIPSASDKIEQAVAK